MHMHLKKHLGIPGLFFLCLVAFILWFPAAKYSNSSELLRSIGQITGLLGAVLLSSNFILAARLKFLDPLFNGLNRIYIVHHLTGALSFILLLFHPVILALWYLPISVQSAAQLLTPDLSNLPVWFGIAALIVMIVLLVITFFIPLRYQLWKTTHQYLGLAILMATIHIYFIPSTTTDHLPLRFYMLGISLAGIIAYLYRTILGRFLVPKFAYTVDHITTLSPDTLEIGLSPKNKAMHHDPGQFLFIDVSSLGIATESHPFSISSAPGSPQIGLAIKSSGDFTATLNILKPGSLAHLEGPFGRFTYSESYHDNQIWIAGGIGLSPFLGMARSLKPDSRYHAVLFYTVSVPEEAVYVAELEAIARALPENFQFVLHPSKTKGRLSADVIAATVPDFISRDIFICGPPPMMASLRTQFKKLKVKNRFIHSEEFSMS